jgi:hypothetical protein
MSDDAPAFVRPMTAWFRDAALAAAQMAAFEAEDLAAAAETAAAAMAAIEPEADEAGAITYYNKNK